MTLAELVRRAESAGRSGKRLVEERMEQMKAMIAQAPASGAAINALPGNLRSLRDMLDPDSTTRSVSQTVSDNLKSNAKALKEAADRAAAKLRR